MRTSITTYINIALQLFVLLTIFKRICFGEAKTLVAWIRYIITKHQSVSYLFESIKLLNRIMSLQVVAKSVIHFAIPVCEIIGDTLVCRMKSAVYFPLPWDGGA